jgi:hypothetical protein
MAESGGRRQPLRYCTICGAQVSPGDAFCGSCGARLSSGAENTAPTQDILQAARERIGGYTLPSFLRLPAPGHDSLLGALLAIGCAVLLVVALYALLAIRGTFSDPSTPGTLGLALFALMHGGAATFDVPPIRSLFGIGGSLRLGLPVTSFVLLPFLASLLGARFIAHRARTPVLFVLVAAVTYALVVAVLAALGAASSQSEGVTVRFAPGPFSTALRAFLWVGLGTMIGVAASRGPLLPARARQVLRGALWAVGISVAVTIVLAVVIALAQQGLGTPVPAQRPTEGLPQPALGVPSVREVLTTIGTVFTLLPIALGNLWLLAHGVPVGFQRAPDLSGIPLVGKALADVPLRVALLGHWPWGVAWRLLLLGPIIGLIIGGMVAARGAPPEGRWRQGALVTLPYTMIALLTAVLVGASADVTLAEAARLEVAFRASLAWLLLLLPVGAALGAAGGLLTRADAFLAPHPQRAFLITSIASALILLASLPALAALSPGGNQPVAPLASEGQPFSSPPSASPEPTTGSLTLPSNETTTPPPAESGGVDSPADPAFDPLLPTLRQKTSAPIMLPVELPEELKNVAVDADRGGDEYGILFLYEPSGNVVESYVHANDAGTIVAAPEPPYAPSEVFEATKEEAVELPDGTEANLRYMEPKEGELVNQGPFWEGSFEREGYNYVLRVPLADPSGEIARRVLSTMVEVPEEASSDGGSEYTEGSIEEDRPAPGYNLIQSPDRSLTVEIPPSWSVETGEDSEKQAGPNTWSYHAGEYLTSSITTAPSLEAWYGGGTSGAYMVASRTLAQQYTDYELIHSLLYANKAENCTKGPYKDYNREPYSGKIQTWYGCGEDGATTYTVAAAPEGRECVVVFDARISDEADRQAIEHLIDTFEVDCGRVASGPLPSPSASASPSAASESSASALGSASASPCPQGSVQNAAGNTCTDLQTGEIVRERPLPENPNTNPCPEMWTLNEQGRCEQIPLP